MPCVFVVPKLRRGLSPNLGYYSQNFYCFLTGCQISDTLFLVEGSTKHEQVEGSTRKSVNKAEGILK